LTFNESHKFACFLGRPLSSKLKVRPFATVVVRRRSVRPSVTDVLWLTHRA